MHLESMSVLTTDSNQVLDLSLPNSGLKAEPHIKSRMKTWKAHFSIVYDLVHTSGFGWDEEKKWVVAEDSVWDEYVNSHKGAGFFGGKSFLFYEKLSTIFGKDRTTGSYAINLEEKEFVQEMQRSSNIDGFDFMEEDGQDSRQSDGPATSVTSKQKKAKISDIAELYRESCREMKESFDKFRELVGESANDEKLEACEYI